MNSIHAHHLFWRRVRDYLLQEYSIIKSLVDWTVWLYILIPGLLFAGNLYDGLWTKVLPLWLDKIPLVSAAVLLQLVIFTGGVILFVEEADVLFLRQKPDWMKGIMVRGLLVSAAFKAVITGIIFAVLSPILFRHYELTMLEMMSLYVFATAAYIFQAIIYHFIRIRLTGIIRWLVQVPVALLMSSAFLMAWATWSNKPDRLFILSSGLAIVITLFIHRRIHLRGTFYNDVREDQVQRTKLTALILLNSVDKPKRIHRKPWIFRKSNQLIRSQKPAHRLAASAIKAFYRNWGQSKAYFQLTALSIAAVLLPPPPANLIVYLALLFLHYYWMSSFWKAYITSEFITILPFQDEVVIDGSKFAVQGLMLIPSICLGFAAGLAVFSAWWGPIIMIPVSLFLTMSISRFGVLFWKRRAY
ncbi:ABC transporter permease [Paenibacillus sediminis]|uniref:ABC-2 type transport system permease protein n=1 Tax=Paenibacillus sediminis TaxID=664909 RepID=A0ABS4H680_9BACL|nr:ABC-2 type transport system permease protein [Paenibacillus sediminis]